MDTDYAVVRDSPTGTLKTGLSLILVDQRSQVITETQYYLIHRTVLYFPTIEIPENAIIESAKIRLYSKGISISRPFSIVVQNGQPTYPHLPPIKEDYNRFSYSGNGGEWIAEKTPKNTYIEIPLNALGLTWINKDGITKLCLRTNEDINNLAPPSGITYWYNGGQFCSAEHPDNHPPELIVTWK